MINVNFCIRHPVIDTQMHVIFQIEIALHLYNHQMCIILNECMHSQRFPYRAKSTTGPHLSFYSCVHLAAVNHMWEIFRLSHITFSACYRL